METITLSAPVTKGERTIGELTFADPKVKHLLALDGRDINSTAAAVAFVSALTGEPELLIRELDPPDWRKVHAKAQLVYGEFFDDDPTSTGKDGDPTAAAEQPKS